MIRASKFVVIVLSICGFSIINSCKKDPVLATLTTSVATEITATSFVSGGNITNDGGAEITDRGICYGTTLNPDISGNHLSSEGGAGSFSNKITGLSPNTQYHIRAYATNSKGTAYGPDVTATTVAVTIPTLTTASITGITVSSAISGGSITSDGNDSITVRGVCWALTANPTISGDKTTDGKGKGNFTSNISGLQSGSTYHVRAYATNSIGTAYGDEITFTAAAQLASLTTADASLITLTTAVSGGNVTSDGGSPVTARGACWSTEAVPTISGSNTSDGTGTGSFTSNLTGLTANTLYHVRAYATNGKGTAYGNEITFTTLQPTLPELTTAAVTSIEQTTAVSGGNITSDGGSAISVRGICWATTLNPTIANSITTDGSSAGNFVSNITGLSAGVTYHVRAYATNVAGTAYGNDIQFTTTSPLLPSLTTVEITNINLTTAVSGGTITSDGGAAITVSGICWSTSANPTTGDSRTTDGLLTGTFSSNLIGLTPGGTVYYVRAYATNSSGTSYGNQLSFSTKLADVDGNTYKTVIIGTQVWMAENLKTTLYNNGTSIPYVELASDWIALSTPAYCWYNNNQATFKPLYGAIYNWYTLNTGNLCPAGWHAPSDAEFNTLELYLGVPAADINTWGWRGTNQGSQLKSTTGWAGGLNGTNTSGFTGLPGGYRYGLSGSYNDAGNLTYWWSTTVVADQPGVAWYRRIDGTRDDIYKAGVIFAGGKYVRCIKN